MAHTDRSSENQEQRVKTILVVEDDAGVGPIFVEALNREAPSYRALLATNELEALAMVKTVVPDLFMLDSHLPHMNGLELSDCLHATEALKRIPVLLMSANAPKQELETRQMSYLKKPFELAKLFHIIEILLAE
jgi:CheY-like chemotaxis protein